MKYTVSILLVLTALSLNAQQESRIPPESTRDPTVQKLIQTYCGDAPSSKFTRIKSSDGSLHEIPTTKLDAAKKADPTLEVLGEVEYLMGSSGQFERCRNMVLQKAIDADFSTLIEENRKLRSALHSFCALPDIGRTAKDACFTLWRDLDAKRK